MIRNPMVKNSVEFYYSKNKRIVAVLWAGLTVLVFIVFLLGGPWGEWAGYFPFILILLFWHIKHGYRALIGLPVISFTSKDFEFHCQRDLTGAGSWGEVELINDEVAKNELYIHFKSDAPLTLLTKGLNSSHEEIKNAAIAFHSNSLKGSSLGD